MTSPPKPPAVPEISADNQPQLSVLIFANGPPRFPSTISHTKEGAQLVVAADGGANYCSRLGFIPDMVIGDMDSIATEILEDYKAKGITIDRHEPRKDQTDLELALDYAVKKGATTTMIYGALGGRWDMSLANILLAASNKYNSMIVSLHDKECVITIHHPGRQYFFLESMQTRISFLPLNNAAVGLTLSGFDYPLNDHTLFFGSTQGVSNIITSESATAHHTDGVIISVQSIYED